MTVTVLKPGLFSTIQDAGRFGYRQYGVIVSGATDQLSYSIGQALLQQQNTAAIEVTMIGPTLQFQVDTVIAITGANCSPLIDGKPCAMWRPVVIKQGSILSCQVISNGMRSYIAFKGGIQVPVVLHSRSTYIRAKIGGYNGRALQKGDILPIHPGHLQRTNYFVQPYNFSQSIKVRVTKSTEWAFFTKNSLQHFLQASFTLTREMDRMGYRLQSACPLATTKPLSLLSDAVTFGTIQVPPNGQPIILMADHQTTGGYAKIAQVICADLPLLAQLQPNALIHFEVVTIAEAQQIYIKKQRELSLLQWS